MKRRSASHVLLGAAALTSVTLLSGCGLWPKAWTSQPKPAETTSAAQAAPCPEAPASAPPAPAAIPQGHAAPQPLQSAPATPVPAAAPPAAAAPTPAAARPRLTAADLPRGYYVNVGLFAVLDNGINAHRKLENAGLPALSDSVTTRKGELTRVRVGPFATRAQADAAAKKILGLKLEAVVFRH